MIELILVPVDQKPLLSQLMQLYLYDFTDFTGDDIPLDGFYKYAYLDYYWSEPGRYPFFIEVEGRIAGFVLVRTTQDEGGSEIHHIAEFFIMRKYRRKKVGQTAAWMTFDYFPGKWQVAEIPENLPAQSFWRRIINEYTDGNFIETTDSDGSPIQSFNNLRK
jgi:predicted acetyltransferase